MFHNIIVLLDSMDSFFFSISIPFFHLKNVAHNPLVLRLTVELDPQIENHCFMTAQVHSVLSGVRTWSAWPLRSHFLQRLDQSNASPWIYIRITFEEILMCRAQRSWLNWSWNRAWHWWFLKASLWFQWATQVRSNVWFLKICLQALCFRIS